MLRSRRAHQCTAAWRRIRDRCDTLRNEQELVLSVEDNGMGYHSAEPPLGNGLRGLRERFEEFQGFVSLTRRAPRGCVLRASVPESGSA